MIYFLLMLLILINGLWLVLTFFALPGNWMIVVSTCLFAWWRGEDGIFSVFTLVLITLLALLGEIIEFFAGAGGAKRAGASWLGSIGAIAGAVTGAVVGTFVLPIPLFGTLLGACCGAGIGAWILELSTGVQSKQALRFGFGAGVGQLIGLVTKVAIGFFIWLIVAVAAFWP